MARKENGGPATAGSNYYVPLKRRLMEQKVV